MSTEPTLLEKLDAIGQPLKEFDAFPKLPSTYKSRSEGRGFLTIFVTILSIVLVLNDVAEYVWGWQETEFGVDSARRSYMPINVDIVVNMPCQYLSVDLRDAVGDRLHLSDGFKRDGTVFDSSQARELQRENWKSLTAREAIRASRKSRGFFSFWKDSKPGFQPTRTSIKYQHKAAVSACRVYGSLGVKKVTANLHITTLGHGYTSHTHTDHSMMNLSHVITEFSFGPYIPDIVQPLDSSVEIARSPFMAYQYFITVVPTTYKTSRTYPVRTNQYSVTHYVRTFEHGRYTPGIFFKFDLDPMMVTISQRTTTLIQLVIRCVGVIGGVWVCMGWAVKVGSKVTEVVSGPSKEGIVAAEASGVSRKRWIGGELRSRPAVRNASPGWGDGGSQYASYANSPIGGGFMHSAGTPASPYVGSARRPVPPPSAPPSSAGIGRPSSGYFQPSPNPNAGFASPFPPSPGAPGAPNQFQPASPPRAPGPPSTLRSASGDHSKLD